MTNFEECIDGSAWLSMARIDPAWRRQGAAIFLQQQIAAHATRSGITTLRLWAFAGNKASVRACQKGGFRQVCEAAHISCHLRLKKREVTMPPSSVPRNQLRSFLKSSYLSRMNGYIGYKWHFLKLDAQLLSRLQKKGELYLTEDSVLLVTEPEKRFKEPQSSLTILRGPTRKSLQEAKRIAGSLGARILASYIPYNPYHLRLAKKLGFRRAGWGKHCLIFEKKITNETLSKTEGS